MAEAALNLVLSRAFLWADSWDRICAIGFDVSCESGWGHSAETRDKATCSTGPSSRSPSRGGAPPWVPEPRAGAGGVVPG